MKKLKVSLGFIPWSLSVKIAFYRNVIKSMRDNTYFLTPDVSLDTVAASLDKLEASSLAASDGSHTAIAMRNADVVVVDNHFRTLAAYVDRIANGDEVIILSSGFQTTKETSPITKSPLTVVDGSHSGSVKLMAKAIEKAGAYIWQMAKDGIPDIESGWIIVGNSTQATFEVSGLAVATRYYFRVAAITPDGTTDFTAPVMKIVV